MKRGAYVQGFAYWREVSAPDTTAPVDSRIRPTCLLVACVFLLISACGRDSSTRLVERNPDAPDALLIRNVRVFDARAGLRQPGLRDVLVRDGRIAAVEPAGMNGEGARELGGSPLGGIDRSCRSWVASLKPARSDAERASRCGRPFSSRNCFALGRA